MIPHAQRSASMGGRGGHRSWACRARRLSEAVGTRSGLAGLLQTAGDSSSERMRARRPIWRQKCVDVRERVTQQEATIARKGGSGRRSRTSWGHHTLTLVSQSPQWPRRSYSSK